jgi:dihydrofolate synthase/folylpolyglutamate synthase
LVDTYQQALDYLYSFIDYETMHQPRQAAHYDLRRMEELLSSLGNPHLKVRTVHIAGTKGKGSTAAMIASALAAAGYTTGLYTSPHLTDIRERFRINGRLITRAELADLVWRLKPEVTAVNRRAVYGQLTTFELMTALGFCHFAAKGVDFQVVEVGLGGRLDATNVVSPEVGVITIISLDHTEVLGDSLAAVATEKAGIIKPGMTVVSAPQPPAAARVIEETCLKQGAGLIRVGTDVSWRRLSLDEGSQLLEIKGRCNRYRLSLSLLGSFQQVNAATAVATLEALVEKGFNISPEAVTKGLGSVSWPGRFQIIRHRPAIVLDGAHNPAAAAGLVASLGDYFNRQATGQAILVFGASVDKDLAGIVTALSPYFSRAIVTRSRHPRAMAGAPVEAEFSRHGLEVEAAASVAEALKRALTVAGEEDVICVTGSLFVVGEAIEALGEDGLEC